MKLSTTFGGNQTRSLWIVDWLLLVEHLTQFQK